VAIRKCMQYKVIFTRRYANRLAVAAWLSAIISVSSRLIFASVGGKAVKYSFVVENFIAGVALILIIYFYAVVYHEVRQRKVSAVNQVSIYST